MRVWSALLLAVAAAASTAAAVNTPCTAAKYADAYATTKAQLATCEMASGVTPLELPLTAKVKLQLCDACPELAAIAKAKSVAMCMITQSNGASYTLRQQLTKLFKKCTGDSDSGSQDTSASVADSTPAPTPKTPTVTTKTPTATTKAPTTKSSSVATESSVEGDADSSPSAASGSVVSGKATTTTMTSAPSSSSKSDTSQQTSDTGTGSSMSIGVIAGIVVGVLGVAAVCVYFVMTRRRRKNGESPGKYNDAMLDSSRGLALNLPFHNAMRTVNLNGSSSSDNSGKVALQEAVRIASTTVQSHLWDDELIVAARIPKDKVVAMTLLSRGGFGEVHRGVYNGQQVAIKMLLPETRKEMREINLFFIEVKLMARLEHQRIVTFVGVAWDSLNDVCVVTEFMEGGDLRDLLTRFERERRPTGFDQDKIKIALHVAHALTYMHSLQPMVLHRDLKSKNILLDNQLNAKLTDFGVSRERSDSTMTAGVGTSLWMAPEVMLGRRYDDKADIFSFGVVLSELDSHALPYAKAPLKGSRLRSNKPVTASAMLKRISLGELSVEFSEDAPLELVAIAEACVSYDPEDRPSATDVLYMLHNVLRELHMSVSF